MYKKFWSMKNPVYLYMIWLLVRKKHVISFLSVDWDIFYLNKYNFNLVSNSWNTCNFQLLIIQELDYVQISFVSVYMWQNDAKNFV
jgi:hypothetical protein